MTRALLALLILVAPAVAEENFTAQLNRAERSFQRESANALLPEYERYVTELATLEKSLIASEDFEGAALVQGERLKIRNLIASVKAPSPAKRRPHTFKIADAVLEGDTLTWTPPSPIASGGYKVSVEPQIVDAVISEGFHTAKPGGTLRITSGNTISIRLPSGAEISKLILTPGA